jgi:hypothetical protein
MKAKEEFKAFTDAAFMPEDENTLEVHGIVPLREVELVKYELDSDTITVDFCGNEYDVPLENIYREAKRPGNGPKPRKVFKTIFRKIANRKEIKSVIGVS